MSTTILKHAAREHSPFSPSTLKSIAICSGFQNDETRDTKYADRGSRGHECVENNTSDSVTDDPQLKEAIDYCLEFKNWLINKNVGVKVDILQEQRVSYFDQWGFCDLLIVAGNEVYLVDWKFAGNFYEANSPQFWAYCLGIWREFPNVDTIGVYVVHPFRHEVDTTVFRRHEHLEVFAARVIALINKGKRNDTSEYQASSQCAYCGRAGKCKTLAQLGMQIGARYEETFVEVPLSGTVHGSEVFDPKTMASLLRLAPIMEKAAHGWKKAGVEMWTNGIDVPGFTLQHISGRRSLDSASSAFQLLRDRIPLIQFLDACSISVPKLEDLYASTAPRGKKEKYKQQLMALLEDENLLSGGAGSAYLRPISK